MGWPQVLPNGDLFMPISAEHEGVLGDAVETIGKDDPQYAELREAVERLTSPTPEKPPPNVH